MPAYPENALATFEHTLRYAPALIECDVRLSRDSVLVMMHDDTLDRTTTGTGLVADYTLAELRTLLLVDERGVITPFRIPTLAETLSWAEHRAILTLDVKQDVAPRRIINLVRQMNAEDRVVIIIYTLDELFHYHELAPDLNISASASTLEEAYAILDSGVDLSRLIVFTGVGEVNQDVIDLLHTHGIRAMLGTFDLIDERARQAGATVYDALLDRGVDVIATDRVPLAAEAANARRGVER
jgi:glycerophosphoryl diester phosphodiesterase